MTVHPFNARPIQTRPSTISILLHWLLSHRTFLPMMLLFIAMSNAQASVIEQLDFKQMADTAELVFEGQVIASEAKWNSAGTRIDTFVTFRVDDVIKGQYAAPNLQLRFGGGQVGEARLKIEGQVFPQSHEMGIYFVETLSRHQVNPLVGWSQGHFLIDSRDDESKAPKGQTINHTMMMNDRKPLKAIDRSPASSSQSGFSSGQVKGAVPAQLHEDAMSKDEFKHQLREMLAE